MHKEEKTPLTSPQEAKASPSEGEREEHGARPDQAAEFDQLIEDGQVGLRDLVAASVLRSPLLTEDPELRAIGERYAPKLRTAFRNDDDYVAVSLQREVGLGAALGSGPNDPLEISILRKTIRFDWTAPRRLLLDVDELEQDVRRWIPDVRERHSLLQSLFSVTTQLQTTIGRENARCPSNQDESAEPSDQVSKDLDVIRPQIELVRKRFLGDAQRSAQVRYAKGMGLGAVGIAAVCCVLAGIFSHWGIQAVNGVGLLAGAVGACVSVLQRMTARTLALDIQTSSRMLEIFGAVRPLIGGIFGLITFCIFKGELISAVTLPSAPDAALAFVAVFGFLAAFNERFFQDMLKNAGRSLEPSSNPETTPAPS